MCGICGKLNLDFQEPVDRGLLCRMMDLLHHRGPDGGGEYRSGPVGLGHRRLSIIDLNTGDQPMSNEDGTVWVVYNGEIYNYPELRAGLLERGHAFKSTTDTEVIVHLYEESGVECISQLQGMFAFSLWDERKQFLLIARDRVGIKPLYYTNTGRALVFASEMKALLADPTVVRRTNVWAIDRFLTYGYLPGNETLLEGIYKLYPGHYLTACRSRIDVQQYWDLHFNESLCGKSFNESAEILQELLRRSVKDHMISDVPVGVLLSGGVDSTGVLRYAVENTDSPLHTFTVGFEGAEFADERPYARLAAQRFGSVHHEMTMTAGDFQDFLPKYVWHMEEPVFEPPAIALYFVTRLARESSVKVLLSGEGGDEAFGGYQTYRNNLLLERLKSAFGPAKGLLRCGLKVLGDAGWQRAGRYSDLVDPPMREYYLSRTETPFTAFNRLRDSLYTKDFVDALDEHPSALPTRHLFEQINNLNLLNQMLYIDSKTWLPDDLLVKADKMTMATSVELRVPLLDYRLLEFAAGLPPHYKVRGWSTKRILKKALEESIPQEIIRRKKTGFPVPYTKWLRSKEMHDFVFDTILDQNNGVNCYFQRDKIQELLEAHKRADGYSKEVFCLLVLGLWHQVFEKIQFTMPSNNLIKGDA